MAKIVKGTQTNQWLPPNWRKSTFPILSQPAKTLNDITGTAFLLDYKSVPYIVTAYHVIESENPVIAFAKKDTQFITVSTAFLKRGGLRRIKHPAGLDLAGIPFHLPLSIVKELDLVKITEDKWTPQPKIKLGDEVAHLGYPHRGTSNYLNGSPCLFPQAMPGKIIAPLFSAKSRNKRSPKKGDLSLDLATILSSNCRRKIIKDFVIDAINFRLEWLKSNKECLEISREQYDALSEALKEMGSEFFSVEEFVKVKLPMFCRIDAFGGAETNKCT